MSLVAIVSRSGDFHAQLISKKLQQDFGTECLLIDCDQFTGKYAFNAHFGDCEQPNKIRKGSADILLGEVDAIWWRRAPSLNDFLQEGDANQELIANETYSGLSGILVSSFQGRWISDPYATSRASNKLVQLRAAERVGLKVPKTLIGQDFEEVCAFFKRCNRKMVVKPLHGLENHLIKTRILSEVNEFPEQSVSICPSIYQEYVDGITHLRVNVFGREVCAFSISSQDIDWRFNLDIPIEKYELSQDLAQMLFDLLDELNLAMGVIDLKISNSGEVFFFEINPQGQFLFLEPITKVKISDRFCEFLKGERG